MGHWRSMGTSVLLKKIYIYLKNGEKKERSKVGSCAPPSPPPTPPPPQVPTALGLYENGRKEMFYLTTQSTHFIYGYMASDIWQRTTHIVSEETRYSFRLAGRVLLYASSHRQDYTSRWALAGTRNSPLGPP